MDGSPLHEKNIPVVVIIGTTGAGKSDLAIDVDESPFCPSDALHFDLVFDAFHVFCAALACRHDEVLFERCQAE